MGAALGHAEAHAAEAEARDVQAGAAEPGGRHGLHGCECASLSLDSSAAQRLRSPRPSPRPERCLLTETNSHEFCTAPPWRSPPSSHPPSSRCRLPRPPDHADRARGAPAAAPTPPRASSARCSRRSWASRSTSSTAPAAPAWSATRAIAAAPPDGYTIGLITVEIGMMHWQGLTDLTGTSYTPLGARQRRPGRRAGARRLAVQDRQRPGRRDQGQPRQVQGLGHRPGRHLAPGARRHAAGPEGRSRPPRRGCRRNGAAPGLQDLVAGGVEIVPCSLPEARSLIDAGKVKSLAIMDDNAGRRCIPNVPTLKARPAATGRWPPGAAWPRPRACRQDVARQARGRDQEDRRQQGIQRLHGAAAASA